jgi:hypothetical protein
MKGDISTWIWVVGGLIIGVSVILFATTMASGFFKSYQENAMREKFLNLADRINAICSGGEGNTDYFKFVVSDVVRAVYPAKNQFERPPDKVSELITNRETGEGNHICFSLFEKQEPSCRETNCPLEMEYIGTPSLKEDLFTLLAKIRGEYPVYTYNLVLEKSEGRVWVAGEVQATKVALEGLDVDVLAACDGNPVMVSALDRGLVVFGDATLWIKGNTEFAKLLVHIHGYLGKGRTLVVYEGGDADPDSLPRIKSALEEFDSVMLKHAAPLSHMFQAYDQIWLVRPGWCESEKEGCGGTMPWQPEEIRALGDFVGGGGKVFILTDYQGGASDGERKHSDVINGMLEAAGAPFGMEEGYVCRTSTLKILDEENFPDLGRIDIRYASVWKRSGW